MKKVFLLLTLTSITLFQAFAEKVSGTVTDAADGEPLIGATVMIKEKPGAGAATDIDGKYEIDIQPGQT